MKKAKNLSRLILVLLVLWTITPGIAQLNPAITSWLQNTTETGTYYMQGNPTALDNGILYNCQKVEYSDEYVYVTTGGIPSYPTGPFLDGNPSNAQDQNAIYKMPLFPEANLGTPISTNGGNIGIFINGVSLFDFRDGVGWNSNTNMPCGGPQGPNGNDPCPGGPGNLTAWSRDAIPAERDGFDCSKAHPAMGNYHHHQNPSAFKLDLEVVSDVCNLYDADGLYAIDSTTHSPLIGFAYDGFPIYGAYGYKNTDGTGGITRIKSGYHLRDITERTEHADDSDVGDGPNVSGIYFLGYYREDYEYIASEDADVLDVHNGRFCVTPEYPEGIYAYFATVDENWNSAYPYVVGPTFYGIAQNRKVNNVNEETSVYTGPSSTGLATEDIQVDIFPNPSSDLIAVQINGVLHQDYTVELLDLQGKLIAKTQINKGATIGYFDVQLIYAGTYLIKVSNEDVFIVEKVTISR